MNTKNTLRGAFLMMVVGVVSMALSVLSPAVANADPSNNGPAKASKVAPAAKMVPVESQDCQSSVTDTPTDLVVKACSYSETEKSASVKSAIRAKVKGKTQLSYINPHAVAWNRSKALKCQAIFIPKSWYNGPKAKVKQRIKSFAMSHLSTVDGHQCLRLKHGSWWYNAGKKGHRKVPVLMQVSGNWSLMVQNSHSGVLEHFGEDRPNGFWLVCGNDWIWVALNAIPENKVLWVRSENDVLKDATVHGVSGGSINLSGTKQCPGGPVDWSINQFVFDEVDIHNLLKQRVIAAASGPAYAAAMASAIESARAKAVSEVVTTLSISCSNPPEAQPPTVSASADCTTPASPSVTVSFTSSKTSDTSAVVNLGSQSKTVSPLSNGSGQAKFTVPGNGTYSGTVTVNPSGQSASFAVSVNCTAPVSHWTQLSCMNPEEVFVGEAMKVVCDVTSDNNAQSFLNATANNGNVTVSGVKCKSTSGPSCPGNGTFEFTIVGVHEGTSSVTVTASANGVNATPVTYGPFPVDPHDGGF